MIYGGTNWANIGDPALYTSYDYAGAIREDRTVTSEKYSELKLQATFMTSNLDYLTTTPGVPTTGLYSDNVAITVIPITNNDTSAGSFYMVRHTDYLSTNELDYTVTLPTSLGNITIPQNGNHLSLIGRDSKLMATDLSTMSPKLLYSTADIFTYESFHGQKVLALYAAMGEYNELAMQGTTDQVKEVTRGGDYSIQTLALTGNQTSAVARNTRRFENSSTTYVTIGWQTPVDRTVIRVGDLILLLLSKVLHHDQCVEHAILTIDRSKLGLQLLGVRSGWERFACSCERTASFEKRLFLTRQPDAFRRFQCYYLDGNNRGTR